MFVCDDNLITFWKAQRPSLSLAGGEGRCLVLWRHPWSW